MNGKQLLPMAAALALLSSCKQTTAPEPLAGVQAPHLLSVSESRDSLRVAFTLGAQRGWEGILEFNDGSGRLYGIEKPGPLLIYSGSDGYRWFEGGSAVAVTHGGHVALAFAWADIGGRRGLSYWFDLRDTYSHRVALWAGTFTPDAVASR